MNKSIRVIVADDHPLLRDGVAHALNSFSDITVVGQAASGEEAINLARELQPDVALLDVSMPGCGGIVAAREIVANCPQTRVLMLTVSDERDVLLAAMRAGARSYILKGVSGAELASSVRATADGSVCLSPSMVSEIHGFSNPVPSRSTLDQLTQRETEVLALVGEGLTNKEIGVRVHLSEKTVKHYITGILQKLQVRSRVEAALAATKAGLKPP